MAPLLGDNRAPSEDAHYEVQQLDLTGQATSRSP